MTIVIGADGGKLGGIVRAAEGVADASQYYAGRKRLKERDAQADRLNDESVANAQQERTLRAKSDARAQAEADRQAASQPTEDAIAKERLRGARTANDQNDAYNARTKQAQDFEDQVEIDSHRQEQAQQYKRVTGEDMPESYWEKDAQGHKPGEPGWHWTEYDPRSPVPIKVQLGFNKSMSEAAMLPPGASRAEKAAAARRDAHSAIVESSKQQILDEIGAHLQPEEDGSGKQAEPDPTRYVPKETYQQMEQLAKDPTADPDVMRRKWDTVQKSHAQEIAHAEARATSLERIDTHFQSMAERDAQFGHLGGAGVISQDRWDEARALRHMIEASTLSGGALNAAEKRVYEILKGDKPKGNNDKTGFSPGRALELAMTEAADPMSPLHQEIKANPDRRDIAITMRARTLLNSAMALAGGSMPGTPQGDGGHPNPNAAPAQPKLDDDTLATKAVAAGWTFDEARTFRDTGKAPAGKPPLK